MWFVCRLDRDNRAYNIYSYYDSLALAEEALKVRVQGAPEGAKYAVYKQEMVMEKSTKYDYVITE